MLARSIVRKTANSNPNQNEMHHQSENYSINNDNLKNILHNKNKKKGDTKIERLDFLSSSFQNSFQSNSNNIDIAKIPINNNKIFNNVFNVKPITHNGIQNKLLHSNNNSTNNIEEASKVLKRDFTNERLSENFNIKNLNLCINSPINDMMNINQERELLKKNLGIYETENHVHDVEFIKEANLNVKKESMLDTNIKKPQKLFE